MHDNSMAANLVATRGNRCTASIMGWMESNAYHYLPREVQVALRQNVIDNVNSFKDLAIDIVKSDTAMINQIWVQKLDEIHKEIKKVASNGSIR